MFRTPKPNNGLKLKLDKHRPIHIRQGLFTKSSISILEEGACRRNPTAVYGQKPVTEASSKTDDGHPKSVPCSLEGGYIYIYTPIMENQMEKNMENEMEAVLYRVM